MHERGEEEERLADERLAGRVGAAADDARRHRHQQPEQQGAAVAHEDPRRVEVVRQEPEAEPDGDDRHHRPEVRLGEQVEVGEPLGVEEERAGADGDDAGGQPVEAVDEVDRLGHAEQPQHRDQRDPVVGQEVDVEERDAEVVHRDAEPDEHEAGDARSP